MGNDDKQACYECMSNDWEEGVGFEYYVFCSKECATSWFSDDCFKIKKSDID